MKMECFPLEIRGKREAGQYYEEVEQVTRERLGGSCLGRNLKR